MTTRTIVVTGGFSGAVVVDLQDSLRELEDSTFRLALVPVGQSNPPDRSSMLWRDAQVIGATDERASISTSVDSDTSLGTYNLAVDVVTNGKHEAVWVKGKLVQRRALVSVR